MKRAIILIISILLLLTSCGEKDDVNIDAINYTHIKVLTSFDDIALPQQGMRLSISSLDFDLNKSYGITITSPLETYSWRLHQLPIMKDKIPTIVTHELLMPNYTQFLSGIYSLEILQDDVSFLASSFEYERDKDEKPLEPITVLFIEEGDETSISLNPLKMEGVTIQLFDSSHVLLLELKETYSDEKFQRNEFIESIDYLIVYKDDNSIYRIIL